MRAIETMYGDHLKALLSFYDELLDIQKTEGLVIPSGIPKARFLDDNDYPFKVNIHFKALIPVTNVPHSYIIYRTGEKPILIFYQPEDYWHVVPSDPEGDWVSFFTIQKITNSAEWVSLLPDSREDLVWLGEPQEELETLGIHQINPATMLNPIHYRRAYKSDYEIDCLRRSSLKAAKGHLAAKKTFLCGASELEIHLAYLQASSHKEEELPYGNIVALNHHGAVLHYTDMDRERYPKSEIHSFLLDAGADHHGYCSDITRTWSYRDGEFSDLIAEFNQLQLQIIAELKAGISYIDLHLNTHLKIAKFLQDKEFIFCDPETALETGISSTFFPHGLGHLLGLQVHDIGGYQVSPDGETLPAPKAHSALRLTRRLETDFCITIEPGIYFIDLLLSKIAATKNTKYLNWSKIDAYKKYGGIRIEDDVLITENGCENLTREAFAQLAKE